MKEMDKKIILSKDYTDVILWTFCSFSGEVMVCVLDFKRDVGLWHGILCVSTFVWHGPA